MTVRGDERPICTDEMFPRGGQMSNKGQAAFSKWHHMSEINNGQMATKCVQLWLVGTGFMLYCLFHKSAAGFRIINQQAKFSLLPLCHPNWWFCRHSWCCRRSRRRWQHAYWWAPSSSWCWGRSGRRAHGCCRSAAPWRAQRRSGEPPCASTPPSPLTPRCRHHRRHCWSDQEAGSPSRRRPPSWLERLWAACRWHQCQKPTHHLHCGWTAHKRRRQGRRAESTRAEIEMSAVWFPQRAGGLIIVLFAVTCQARGPPLTELSLHAYPECTIGHEAKAIHMCLYTNKHILQKI